MILGIEIAITVMGFVLLFTGKGLGKSAVAHPQFRWMGGFLLTLFPVAFAVVFAFGFVWAMLHSDQSLPEIEKGLQWPAVGVEASVAISYAVVAHFWEKAIKRRAGAMQDIEGVS